MHTSHTYQANGNIIDGKLYYPMPLCDILMWKLWTGETIHEFPHAFSSLSTYLFFKRNYFIFMIVLLVHEKWIATAPLPMPSE